ncbi:hypothetical protein OSTOST_16125, partial [Ostertagia ostertagi]
MVVALMKPNITFLINKLLRVPSVGYVTEKNASGLGRRSLVARMSGRAPLLGAESPVLSKDRRRFIIISIFDATLTTLLWLLCT